MPDEKSPGKKPETMGELAESFGPFSPPANFSFEPELEGNPPRPVPSELKKGSYEKGWRQQLFTAVGVGLFLLACSRLGIVRNLSYYFLPLKYLNWAGLGVLVITFGAGLYHFLLPGTYKYISDGVPFVFRVLNVTNVIAGTREAPLFQYLISGDYRHPETGKVDFMKIQSKPLGSAGKMERYSLTVQPGDYVTGIYLPGNFPKSARLYGFMGLNPDTDYIRKDGKRIEPSLSPGKVIAVLIGLVAIFILMIMGFYAIEFRFPMEEDFGAFAIGFGAGAVLFGMLSLVGTIFLNKIKKTDKIKPVGPAILGAILGGVFMIFLLPLVNAGLDSSVPEYREVDVVEFWQETWNGIIRMYDIEYRDVITGETRKYPARVEHMQKFHTTKAGVIEIRKGFLGWPWIRQIHPVILAEIDPEQSIFYGPGKNRDSSPGITLAILLEDGSVMPLGDEMYRRVWDRLKKEGVFEDLEKR